MRYEEWEGFYREILSDFNFSEERDEAAARLLNSIIKPLDTNLLEENLKGKRVNVYGASPALELIKEFATGTNIAANGATSYLLNMGVVPDIVVTDLDGRIEDLMRAMDGGSILVVHAHGDNIDAIRKHVGRLGKIIGTTQTRPFGRLHNFGGFTDGDRAIFLAHHFGAREIHLYGMDFHGEIGRYSFSEDSETKRKKLLWAEKLINHLIKKGARVSYGV
ncbi:MAG: 6-hydroxymethylpterin diphosphokinase MptE-like protein [Candidatus Hydrothermarchaeaceae archaeon]